MAESSCNCQLIIMVLLNFFIFLAGGCALAAGLLLKFSSGFLESEVLTLLNNVKIDGTPLGLIADANVYIMIIGGVFVMVIGALGWCGAYHSIKSCLWMYIIIIVILMLLQIVVVGVWIFIRQSGGEWFRGQMLNLLEVYEGPEAVDDVSKGWNTLFMKAECCGVNNQYENGGTNNDFETSGSDWWANRGSDSIPASCCKGVDETNVKDYIGSSKCPANTPPINFYTTGCYDKIMMIIERYSLIILVVLGIIFFVEVTAVVCACSLVKENKVDIHESERDRRFDRKRSQHFQNSQRY